MLEKCALTIMELNWNQRMGNKKTKNNICHHMLTSSTQLQSRSFIFHVVGRTRTSSKCQKMKNARAKRAKILFFIVKYANYLWGSCYLRRRGCLSFLFPRLNKANEPIWKIVVRFQSPLLWLRYLNGLFMINSMYTALKILWLLHSDQAFHFLNYCATFKRCDCRGQLEEFLLVWLASIWPPLKLNVLLWVKSSEWSI